eukprot:TRINITY_DN27640_c0_g1_i1.p1 TRINITY_DN27640_c0_g1~~TRINITY_DN27640_c0_g1_i1.p1  ORF type:complete len:206 (-),score=16.91 TRINITY_DN27640_c0_g1_i1:180-797(-)
MEPKHSTMTNQDTPVLAVPVASLFQLKLPIPKRRMNYAEATKTIFSPVNASEVGSATLRLCSPALLSPCKTAHFEEQTTASERLFQFPLTGRSTIVIPIAPSPSASPGLHAPSASSKHSRSRSFVALSVRDTDSTTSSWRIGAPSGLEDFQIHTMAASPRGFSPQAMAVLASSPAVGYGTGLVSQAPAPAAASPVFLSPAWRCPV